MRYDTEMFRNDLSQAGVFDDLQNPSRQVLMPLLDGCLEAWLKYLADTTDVLTFVLPHREVMRTTEVFCVFGGKILKIENKRECAWKDYNGDHYFTDHLIVLANDYWTIDEALMGFRKFLKDSDPDLLKRKTKEILPAWSPAFVHRMPDEVRSFLFPGI